MLIFANVITLVSRFHFIILLFSYANGVCQEADERTVVDDLRSDWKVFSDGEFQPYVAGNEEAVVYFDVDHGRYAKGSSLEIRCAQPFSLFLNYKLIVVQGEEVIIDLDSLQKEIPLPWLFGVHQDEGLPWLETVVTSSDHIGEQFSNWLRPQRYFLDFSIITSMVLLTYFVVLLRTNSRLTLDYFNFARLFSIQEREDSLLNSRISASVNIFYYGFSCLLAGFLLLTIFYFGGRRIALADSFVVHSMAHGFWLWIKLSFFILVVLLAKLILLSGLARLFNFKEAIAPQFFNYIRLFFFIFTVSAIICVCYFVFKIQSPGAYSFLLGGINFLLGVWIIVIGLKLLRRSPFRFFHLFSYLCASELIPIVILVKVLNS